MSQPSVCAILLTADRLELTRKAVECFRAQTYPNKTLLIYDTTPDNCDAFEFNDEHENIYVVESTPNDHHGNRKTIGYLRNRANGAAPCNPDIFVHWDSDDYSHPSRISEQVALLQSSGADCVGYSDLLFWREPRDYVPFDEGEAWLYTSPGPKPSPPGTTLCYTREFWERNPFPATSQGEELQFLARAKVTTITSMPVATFDIGKNSDPTNDPKVQPRMIARIHSGNTSTAYDPRKMAAESKRKNPVWQRVAQWDDYCRGVMA